MKINAFNWRQFSVVGRLSEGGFYENNNPTIANRLCGVRSELTSERLHPDDVERLKTEEKLLSAKVESYRTQLTSLEKERLSILAKLETISAEKLLP
jgi:hypothetical protein